MEYDEFVKLDIAVGSYSRIIERAPEDRRTVEAKAVLNTDVEGGKMFLGLIEFFKGYRHLFNVGKTLIPRPLPTDDVVVRLKELWERGKHTPEGAAGYIEAIIQERETAAVLMFIEFLKEGDDNWGASIEGAIFQDTPEELELRFKRWRARHEDPDPRV